MKDGHIISQGSLSNALERDKKLSAAVMQETQQIAKAEEEVTEPKPDSAEPTRNAAGKLVVAEEISEGHVGWSASAYFVVECRLQVPNRY